MDFTEAIRLDPKNAIYYLNRGGAYDKKGLAAQAVVDLKLALKLKPTLQRSADDLRRIESRR